MSFTDRIFDGSSQALNLRAQRNHLLSANIANADTPGFKARDIDFGAAMRREMGALASDVQRTDRRHLSLSVSAGGGAAMYRQTLQSRADGNTVELQREQVAFMDNAIRYQASLSFLDARIKSVRTALRGE